MPLDFANVVSILTELVLGHLPPGTLCHTTSNHVVQPRSPTTSSTHRPSPNIDDNQDLLTTSLDRGRPRMGEAKDDSERRTGLGRE